MIYIFKEFSIRKQKLLKNMRCPFSFVSNMPRWEITSCHDNTMKARDRSPRPSSPYTKYGTDVSYGRLWA